MKVNASQAFHISDAARYLPTQKPAYLRIYVEVSDQAAVKAFEKLGLVINDSFKG